MPNLQIQTITTDYDADEDRLRLSVADADGLAAVLWLTRRLADRLVVALLPWLTAPAIDDAPADVQQAVQTYAQLQARLMQKPARPVAREAAAWQGLVHEINLSSNPQGHRYVRFRCVHGEADAILPVPPLQLRQWLQVIHRCYQVAEWRSGIWPNWMQRASSSDHV